MDNFRIKYQPVFMPAVILAALSVLIFTLGGFIITRISSLNSDISTTNASLSVIADRLNTLRKVEVQPEDYTGTAIEALPATSPALMIISRLNTGSAQYGLILDNINIDSVRLVEEDLSQISISFDIEGEFADISDFLISLSESKPLINLDIIRVSSTGGISRGSMVISSFWAPLPDLLPSISEPITDLTESEKQILSILSDYDETTLEDALPEAQTEFDSNTNPFGI